MEHGTIEDKDASLVAELSEVRAPLGSIADEDEYIAEDQPDEHTRKKRRIKQGTAKPQGESSEARRESHKIIEQKRRQKITDKINELRELLNYPEGSQNKAVVLQAAVDNIKNLKMVCSKLLASHRQLQEDYLHVLGDNERLRKVGDAPQAFTNHFQQTTPDKNTTGEGIIAKANRHSSPYDVRLPDINMSFLYDDSSLPSVFSTLSSRTPHSLSQSNASHIPYGQEVLHSAMSEPDTNGRHGRLPHNIQEQEQAVQT